MAVEVPDKDKLDPVVPTANEVDFYPGEQPIAAKLNGLADFVYDGFNQLEEIFGDLKADSDLLNAYATTLAADLGDRTSLDPLIAPDIDIATYVQQLTIGKTEHELDMVPVIPGTGSVIAATGDSSVIISQEKTREEDLAIFGDWCIRPGIDEGGKQRTSRKLITHAPSGGGTVTFGTVTTGRGTGYMGGTYNCIPEMAVVEGDTPGAPVPYSDYISIVLSGDVYTVTLPNRTKQFDQVGNVVNATLSNTKGNILIDQAETQSYELPRYWFDKLNLQANNGPNTNVIIPSNYIDLYDTTLRGDDGEPRRIEGIYNVRTSSVSSLLRKQFTFKVLDATQITPTNKHILIVPGASQYQLMGALMNAFYNHNHDGDDMVRAISHRALMGLRTNSSTVFPADRTDYYGFSNIDNNDHSMYFHRDGFVDSDIGGGGNVIRGDAVIGSQNTGYTTDHPNYNVLADSYSLIFGEHNIGASLEYILSVTQDTPRDAGRIPQLFTANVLQLTGAPETLTSPVPPGSPGGTAPLPMPVKTVYINDFLRVMGQAVIGTTRDDDLLITGDAYVDNSLVLTPKLMTDITNPEEGQVIYSTEEKSLVVYNGVAWVRVGLAFTTSIGNPNGPSYGAYNVNSTNTDAAATIQAALDYVSSVGGGSAFIQKGTYNLLGAPINIPSNVFLVGTGEIAELAQTNTATAVNFANGTLSNGISLVRITGASKGILLNSQYTTIRDCGFNNCITAIETGATAKDSTIGSGNRIVSRVASTFTDFIFSNTDRNIAIEGKGFARFNEGRPFLSPVNRRDDTYKWIRTSGGGTIAYNDTTDCLSGKGRWDFVLSGGSATWVLNEFLPVSINRGAGGNIGYKSLSGAPQIVAGVIAYDSNLTSLGSRSFLTPTAVNLTTTWGDARNLIFGTDTSTQTKFPGGTKYVQPYFTITGVSNDSFSIDDFGVYPLNGAWGALYL